MSVVAHEIIEGRVIEDKETEASVFGGLDLTGLEQFRDESLAYVELISKGSVIPELRGALEGSLQGVAKGITQKEGKLIIKTGHESLIGQLGEFLCKKNELLVIPASRVTATNVLPFEVTPNEFNPQIDIRILRNSDPKIISYSKDRHCQLEEQLSAGRWFRFALKETVFAHHL